MYNSNHNIIENITKDLNQEQKQAVTAEPAHLLVLAGAGSGKTRVLVHRIAWLIHEQQISPHAVLAVTFTNKAAKEMQQRIESLIGMSSRSLWIGTFHGLAHRLLRLHWQQAGLPQTFQVCDSDDQLRIIKRIQKDYPAPGNNQKFINQDDNKDDKENLPKKAQYYINNQKEKGLRFKNLSAVNDVKEKYLQEIYRVYERQTTQLGLVDFAEILLRAKELFVNNPNILQHYQNRFKHILVDEFQDTNDLQYQWLKLLHADNYYFMVGDDDQSIYSWRGARVEHIRKFCKDYKDAQVIRLEQNYRSTENILSAANSLINNNTDRLGKNLWTAGDKGEPITLYHAFNDIDEANYVVEQVKNHHRQGVNLSNMAVLYRANHQSRQFEESLLKSNIPYRIYGGQRFFERAEIKDALAYLRLMANPFDDAALDRIINWPTRGIGKQSLTTIREYASEYNLALWHALDAVVSKALLKNKARTDVQQFIELIQDGHQKSKSLSLAKFVDYVIEKSGLREHYYKEDKSKDKSRVENLDELVSACSVFEQELHGLGAEQGYSESQNPLQAFLSHAVLESADMQTEEYQDSLNLMTMHSAKGLEFKIVFIVGMEEGLFPHSMCLNKDEQLAEERRLCYVGITRTMEKLYLSFCEVRRLRGEEKYNLPSRFLQEIPQEYLTAEQTTTQISRASSVNSYTYGYERDYNNSKSKYKQSSNSYFKDSYSNDYSNKYNNSGSVSSSNYRRQNSANLARLNQADSDYKLGQNVKHPMFGTGVVMNAEGSGDKARVQVKFTKPHGTKWLVAKIAKLEVI